MSTQHNHAPVHTPCSTRLRFVTSYSRIELILDQEWSSTLHPTLSDRIQLGFSDLHPDSLLVFIDKREQGNYRWFPYGTQGALRTAFQCKSAFDWCRDLLPERFEYVPTVFDLLRGDPEMRGLTLDWPGWTEVVLANATPGNRELLQRRRDAMRFPSALFSPAVINGERVLV